METMTAGDGPAMDTMTAGDGPAGEPAAAPGLVVKVGPPLPPHLAGVPTTVTVAVVLWAHAFTAPVLSPTGALTSVKNVFPTSEC